MKKLIVFAVLILIAGALAFVYGEKPESVKEAQFFKDFGVSFSYPGNYFIGIKQSLSGEREQHTIVLAEDTPENRRVFAGEEPGREGPPTITISIYQNNLDSYTAKSFVEGTSFSNFKLSDGVTKEVLVGGEPGLRYRATGLYENVNVVVARSDYVYMFTAFYLTPEDKILSDFDKLLDTVEFDAAAD